MQKYILTFKNQGKQLNFVLGHFFFFFYIGMTYHVIVQIITRGFGRERLKFLRSALKNFYKKC